ncbi:unnamed protein product, partial [Mesorhabditis belari]|uniref:Nitronate monooxygenase n=1 Tax=Mesorhabditis belari TaxID=2138241 RepID=A0AAF3EPB4_9BILA
MAGTSTPKLAAAVSNAGGLGSIGTGAMNADNARKAIQQVKSLTNNPYNVNLFCHQKAKSDAQVEKDWIAHLTPSFNEFHAKPPDSLREIYKSFLEDSKMFEMLLEEKPPIISFHFGLPHQKHIKEFHKKGIFLFASATSLKEAKLVEGAGIDAIVAQGYEAGGHRGIFDLNEYDECLGTMSLVRLLVKNCHLPVIAAGGIMDGKGIKAALTLGAQAVQMGTAFIGCPESAADDAYRKLLIEKTKETTMTKAISGRPARGFRNRLTELGTSSKVPIPVYPIAYDAGKALHEAAKSKGNCEFGAHWAGQGAKLSRALPAAELIQVLQTEME